jgi:hypothetical protein
MATVMDGVEGAMVSRGRPGAARPSCRSSTLADLVAAIQDAVGPEGDRLVVATVRHLLRCGRLTYLGADITPRPPSRRQTMPTRPRSSSEPPGKGPRGHASQSLRPTEGAVRTRPT